MLLHTRPVLNISPTNSDVRVSSSFVHLHSTFLSSICRISIPNPADSPCTAIGLLLTVTSLRPPFMILLRVHIRKCRSRPYPGTAGLRRVFLRISGTCSQESCLRTYRASFHGLQIEVGEHSCHLPRGSKVLVGCHSRTHPLAGSPGSDSQFTPALPVRYNGLDTEGYWHPVDEFMSRMVRLPSGGLAC